MTGPTRAPLQTGGLLLVALLCAAASAALGQEPVPRDDAGVVEAEPTRSGPSLELVTRVTDLSEKVTALAYHPNGQTLAVGGGDGGLWLFQTRERGDLSVRNRLEPDGRGVVAIAFSADGRVLAAAKEEGFVLIRQVGREDRSIQTPGEAPISAIALSPDGSFLAVAHRDIELWHTGRLRREGLLRGHGAPVRGLFFRVRGRKLFSVGEDFAVRQWMLPEGKLHAARPSRDDAASSVAFGPRGLFFVTGSCAGGTVRVENLAVGTERYALPAGGCVRSVGFSSDGKLAVAAVSLREVPELVFWSLADGSPVLRVPERDFQLMSISSEDGLIAGSDGGSIEVVRIVYPD